MTEWISTLRRFGKPLRIIPLVFVTASTPVFSACGDSTGPDGCCKICKEGKPCGDTCISRSDTCNSGSGCACQG